MPREFVKKWDKKTIRMRPRPALSTVPKAQTIHSSIVGRELPRCNLELVKQMILLCCILISDQMV